MLGRCVVLTLAARRLFVTSSAPWARAQEQRGDDAALLTRARGTTRDRQEKVLFCS